MPDLKIETHSENRQDWADIAKAISIILVVIHHTVVKDANHAGYNEVILQINNSLILLMLPMFFFVSGFFASSAINSNFSVFIRKRAAPLLYLYVLWSLFKWILKTVLPALLLGSDKNIYSIFYIVTEPMAELWFIYALFFYFVFTWLIRQIAPWIVMCFAITVFLIFSQDVQVFGLDFIYRVARFFICFYSGFLMYPCLKDIRKKIPSWSIIIAPPFLFGLYYFIGGLSHIEPIVMLFVILLNVGFGIIISELISRTLLRKPFSFLGKYTLAIYLFHFVPNTVMHKLDMNSILDPFTFVALTVTFAVIGSILAYEVANKIRLGWIYKYPDKFFVKRNTTT